MHTKNENNFELLRNRWFWISWYKRWKKMSIYVNKVNLIQDVILNFDNNTLNRLIIGTYLGQYL